MITLILLAGLLQYTSAATYTVGDATGWTFPPTATFYDDWAKNHTFLVGDRIVFEYTAPRHDVLQVSESAVAACTRTNPIQHWTESDVTVLLTTLGFHGYICSLTNHCEGNMKMRLQVVNVNPPTAAPTTVTPTPPAAGAPGPADSGAFAGQSATALLVGAMAAVFVDLMS